jgi:hypothetical protein
MRGNGIPQLQGKDKRRKRQHAPANYGKIAKHLLLLNDDSESEYGDDPLPSTLPTRESGHHRTPTRIKGNVSRILVWFRPSMQAAATYTRRATIFGRNSLSVQQVSDRLRRW